MMSRKDYERAARIALTFAPDVRRHVTDAFVELFHGDNPRFDEPRFRAACERRRASLDEDHDALPVDESDD